MKSYYIIHYMVGRIVKVTSSKTGLDLIRAIDKALDSEHSKGWEFVEDFCDKEIIL